MCQPNRHRPSRVPTIFFAHAAASAMALGENSNRFSFSWATRLYKQPNGTSDAGRSATKQSMTDSKSCSPRRRDNPVKHVHPSGGAKFHLPEETSSGPIHLSILLREKTVFLMHREFQIYRIKVQLSGRLTLPCRLPPTPQHRPPHRFHRGTPLCDRSNREALVSGTFGCALLSGNGPSLLPISDLFAGEGPSPDAGSFCASRRFLAGSFRDASRRSPAAQRGAFSAGYGSLSDAGSGRCHHGGCNVALEMEIQDVRFKARTCPEDELDWSSAND